MNTASSAAAMIPSTSNTGLTAAEMASYHDVGYVVQRGLFEPCVDGTSERPDRRPAPGATPRTESLRAFKLRGIAQRLAVVSQQRIRQLRQLMHSDFVSPIIDQISRSEEVLAIMRQ